MSAQPSLVTLPLESLTPAEAFRRALAHPDLRPVALLESARPQEPTGRYSFIALDPVLRIQSRGTAIRLSGAVNQQFHARPLPWLHHLLARFHTPRPPGGPPFLGGLVGYFGYDLVRFFERLPRAAVDDLLLPDLDLFLVGTVVAFDHREGAVTVARTAFGEPFRARSTALEPILELLSRPEAPGHEPEPTAQPVRITAGQTSAQYESNVRRALDYIAAGDIFQANLAHRFTFELGGRAPWRIYERLRAINPSPFAAYLDFGSHALVSASPERLVSLRDRRVETRPIAGTRPRSADRQADRALLHELLSNEKERAEHLMLVDLERNDLGRVCEYGSIKVDELMVTERYSHVSHLVSNIGGRLHPGKDWLDLFRAVFPGGTVTGVPKVRCMEIIDELEPVRRGPYSGSIGYVSLSGDLDLNIVIRTLIVQGRRGHLHVGAGIVADSDPSREYAETLYKAQAVRDAVERA
ncbi:MAG: aminodeoxychorismate synthase, component I [Nitrospirota bacterium]